MVSVLRSLHDDLDIAVLDAYGWRDLAPLVRVANGITVASDEGTPNTREGCRTALDDAILERLVALNAERASEERKGLVRWLRPGFQNPAGRKTPEQAEIETGEVEAEVAEPAKRRPWPTALPDQVRAVAEVLTTAQVPLDEEGIASAFTGRGPWKRRLPQILDTLLAVGRARRSGSRYSATS